MNRSFDKLAFFGLVAVLGNVFLGIALAKGSLLQFFDIPSLVIVVLGAFSSTMLTHSTSTFKNMVSGMKVGLLAPKFSRIDLIIKYVDITKVVRKSGFLAMEEELANVDDEFMKKGLQLVVDGLEPEVIKDIMESEINSVEERHGEIIETFNTYASYLPAFGMIGTLIGLIIMLADLSDSNKLGIGMAAALITTFYGSLFANGIFIPLAKKLEKMSRQEIAMMEMSLAGILDIQTGVSPRLIEEKLLTFVSPTERKQYNNRNGKKTNDGDING